MADESNEYEDLSQRLSQLPPPSQEQEKNEKATTSKKKAKKRLKQQKESSEEEYDDEESEEEDDEQEDEDEDEENQEDDEVEEDQTDDDENENPRASKHKRMKPNRSASSSKEQRPKRKYHPISNELRELIIKNVIEDRKSQKEVANQFGTSQPVVSKILKKYRETGMKHAEPKGGAIIEKKLKDCHIRALEEMISDDCSITLEKMKENLLDRFNLDVSVSTISRYLIGFKYSFKRISVQSEKANSLENKLIRKEFAQNFFESWFKKIDDLIFIDETGFTVSMREFYGRSKVGKKAIKTVERPFTMNYTLTAAMSNKEIFYYEICVGAMDAKKFASFIRKFCNEIKNRHLESQIIFMDNVKFHKTDDIQELVDAKGHDLQYLPPYSPQLNPIEYLFHEWKGFVRAQHPTDQASLLRMIDDAQISIPERHFQNYFNHIIKLLPDCAQMKDLTD